MICFKRVSLAVIFVLCQAVALSSAHAATYYVRSGGSNANSGTTWSTAWAHPNKAQSVMVAGDMLVMAPGSYDTVQFVPPAAGGALTSYVCSTYVVNGSDAGRNNTFVRGGRNQSLTWTSIGGNRWTSTFDSPMTGVSPRIYVALFRDGKVCDPRSSTTAADSQNEYAYNTSTNVFTLYSTTNPSSSVFRVSWRPVMDTGPGQSNVLIFGLTIEEGSQRLIVVGDWDHSSPKPDSTYIKYCNLRKVIELEEFHNGSIILSQTNDPTTVAQWTNDLQVVGCTLSQISTVQFDQGIHSGAAIECYFVRDSRIDSNVFIGPMGSAIALKMGCYADNGVKSLNWSIKYNRISDCFDEAVWVGNKVGNLDFVGNIVERCEIGFNIHTSDPCGKDPTQGNIKVLNNTFVNNDVNFNASAANAIGGNQVKYNIFMDTSGAVSDNYVYTLGFRLRGGEAPMETPTTESFWANGVNNNMYYYANGQTFMGWYSPNSGYSPTQPNWSQWSTVFDQNSINGVNPGFASSSTGNYSRPSSSNEINVTHSGATWTRYGAWQSTSGGCTLPGVATLTLPANGATGLSLPVTLDWSDVATATSYQLQIDNNSDFSSTLTDQVVAASTYSATSLTSGVTLYWRVRAQNSCGWGAYSASRTFATAACTLPVAPTLASPANAATNLSQPITLDWNDVATATGYQIQVDNNSDFSSVTVAPTATASTYALSGLAAGTTFYWRVRAQNACGLGSYSASRSFTTTCTLPTVPSFVAPANGVTNLAQPVVLDWSDIAGATLYHVQVDNNSDFSSPTTDNQPTASTYSVSGLTAGTVFYWRMRAQNACGWSAWSASRTFTTASSGDATPPVISNVTTTNITSKSAVISWTTNEAASTQINYGTTVSYGSSTTLISTLTTDHEQVITGLDSMKTYHFRVRSRDAAGNEAISGDYVFTTANSIADGISPTVSSSYTGFSSANISDGNYDPFGAETSTWATESATLAHWVEFNLGASRTVERVAVYWAWNSYQQRWMTSQQFRIQIWNGSAFTDVSTVNNSVGDSCTFVDIAPVATTRMRYYQPVNMGPATYPAVVWLTEIDVFGTTVANTAPTVPTLSSPAAGATVSTLTPALILNNSSDAQGNAITYNFQVSTSSSFATITAQATGVTQGTGTTSSWTVSPSLGSGTTYYWRARSYDGALYSSFSAYRSFTTGSNAAPGAPTPVSPINSVRVSDMTPNLVVKNAIDANGNVLTYQFEVYNGTGTILRAQSPMVNSGATSTTWTVSITLNYVTNYTWRARAYDGQAWSVWTALQSFRTNRAPSSPILESPLEDAVAQLSTQYLGAASSVDPDGDSISYQFEIYAGNDTTVVLKSSTVAADSSTTFWAVPSDLAPGKQYAWRARASDGADWSDWSEISLFSAAAAGICGDEDSSGFVDVRDAIYLLNYIFSNGTLPADGDVNCDEMINISDAVLLLEFLFANGDEPCAKCGQ